MLIFQGCNPPTLRTSSPCNSYPAIGEVAGFPGLSVVVTPGVSLAADDPWVVVDMTLNAPKVCVLGCGPMEVRKTG